MIKIIQKLSNFNFRQIKGQDIRSQNPYIQPPPVIEKPLDQGNKADEIYFVPELLDAPEVFLPEDQYWSWVDLQVDKLNSSISKRK